MPCPITYCTAPSPHALPCLLWSLPPPSTACLLAGYNLVIAVMEINKGGFYNLSTSRQQHFSADMYTFLLLEVSTASGVPGHVCVHIHSHTCTYTHASFTCSCTHTLIHTWAYARALTHGVHTPIHSYAHAHVLTCTCTHTFTCTYTHTLMHTYIQPYSHT